MLPQDSQGRLSPIDVFDAEDDAPIFIVNSSTISDSPLPAKTVPSDQQQQAAARGQTVEGQTCTKTPGCARPIHHSGRCSVGTSSMSQAHSRTTRGGGSASVSSSDNAAAASNGTASSWLQALSHGGGADDIANPYIRKFKPPPAVTAALAEATCNQELAEETIFEWFLLCSA